MFEPECCRCRFAPFFPHNIFTFTSCFKIKVFILFPEKPSSTETYLKRADKAIVLSHLRQPPLVLVCSCSARLSTRKTPKRTKAAFRRMGTNLQMESSTGHSLLCICYRMAKLTATRYKSSNGLEHGPLAALHLLQNGRIDCNTAHVDRTTHKMAAILWSFGPWLHEAVAGHRAVEEASSSFHK
ncbi:uncharacterized protein LOC109513281 [Hippocampus comes]|uniref:uncharacterized protein LOC109513281 n=1 Tax=Hippocampus comes TaxID=109280 RepID=UPI00094F02C3|nr:PREDICTED: uncharacterized protein LOC109513281 [Hippocampus comes]